MEQKNSYSVISIVDLFAYCVRKIGILIIGALIGMIVLLGIHIVSANSEKKIEEFKKEVEFYNNNLETKEKSLENLRSRLSLINDIYDVNPLFYSDELYKARTLFSVDSQKGVTITDSGQVVSEIALEIRAIWDGLDLATVLDSDIPTELLKTFIFFSDNSTMFEITVYADTPETAKKNAEKILSFFTDFINGHADSKVSFSSEEVSKANKDVVNERIKLTIADREELNLSIKETEESIKDLKENEPARFHFFRYSVLGCLAGGLVSALLVAIGFVSKNPIASSFDTEISLSVPFLGVLFVKDSLIKRLSRKIIGERMFKGIDEEENYIRNNFLRDNLRIDKEIKNISIISSIDDECTSIAGKKICSILNDCGFESTLLTDSTKNPEIIDAIGKADAVVLLEKQMESKTQLVKMNVKYVKDYNKEILGFILF